MPFRVIELEQPHWPWGPIAREVASFNTREEAIGFVQGKPVPSSSKAPFYEIEDSSNPNSKLSLVRVYKLTTRPVRDGFMNVLHDMKPLFPDHSTKVRVILEGGGAKDLTFDSKYSRVFGLSKWYRERAARAGDYVSVQALKPTDTYYFSIIKLTDSLLLPENRPTVRVSPSGFEEDIVQTAKEMAGFYLTNYCIENTTRRLISQTLEAKYGKDWWENKVRADIKEYAQGRREDELDTTADIRSNRPIDYITFAQLKDIIDENWNDFSGKIRSKKSIYKALTGLNELRHIIAHSGYFSEDDKTRFDLAVKDWRRIQRSS